MGAFRFHQVSFHPHTSLRSWNYPLAVRSKLKPESQIIAIGKGKVPLTFWKSRGALYMMYETDPGKKAEIKGPWEVGMAWADLVFSKLVSAALAAKSIADALTPTATAGRRRLRRLLVSTPWQMWAPVSRSFRPAIKNTRLSWRRTSRKRRQRPSKRMNSPRRG